MKFHYMGKFNGDPESLPSREHEEGYVPYREPGEKKLMLIMNIFAFAISVPLVFAVSFVSARSGKVDFLSLMIGLIAFMLSIFPHEVLHGLCFKEDVYMYTYLSKGACFVVGPELMSKSRFIFMSMLPNLVFGFLPFIVWCIFPSLTFLGYLGALAIGAGGGDYMNVFNTITQVPNGAKVYMHGMNSFWIDGKKEK